MAGFLELKIERDKNNGTISLTQTWLIDRIIDAIETDDLNHKYTPAENDSLHKMWMENHVSRNGFIGWR